MVSWFMLQKDFLLCRTYLQKTLQIFMFSSGFISLSVLLFFPSIDQLPHICAQFFILFHLTQMRFSLSTHWLMFLSLETLTSIIRTGLPILVELIDLLNSNNFSVSNDLTRMVNFPAQIPDFYSHSPALFDLFLSSDAIICSTMAFPPI